MWGNSDRRDISFHLKFWIERKTALFADTLSYLPLIPLQGGQSRYCDGTPAFAPSILNYIGTGLDEKRTISALSMKEVYGIKNIFILRLCVFRPLSVSCFAALPFCVVSGISPALLRFPLSTR